MEKRLVLFADNKADFRDTRAEFLERAGFHVLKAGSSSEAKEMLQTRWVHVAVLDIRLEDDDDPEDISGLELAGLEEFRHIPKVVLTGFPSYEYVRQALGPSVDRLPPAVNFISKKEEPQALIDAVQEAFLKHLNINWDLAIRWSERCPWTMASMASLLMPDDAPPRSLDHSRELEDLFRRLFSRSEQITLDRMLWRTNDRLALSVFAYAEGLPVREAVVTCGRIEAIRQERASLKKLPRPAPSRGNPRLVDHAETLRFGANCYELVGTDLETIRSFAQFFSLATSREVNKALESLGKTGLKSWHRQSQLLGAQTRLALLYHNRLGYGEAYDWSGEFMRKAQALGREAAAAGLASIEVVGADLLFQFPKGRRHAFPNPATWIPRASPEVAQSTTLQGVTLGELNPDAILVDTEGQTWLTDFGFIAEGPLLGDYAAFETAIKFDLLDDGISLEDVHELESALLAASRLSQRLDPGTQRLSKVVSAVQRVRKLAASTCGPDILPYYWGLLFYAGRRLLAYQPGVRRTPRELLSLLHACMSMGMICARLEQASQALHASAEQPGGLEVNEARAEVRVDGQLVQLSPIEFSTLEVLWEHREQVCSRKTIVESVYDHSYEPGKLATDDAKLSVVIDRLRQKIEMDPSNPRYLITRRGRGYILYPRGKPG